MKGIESMKKIVNKNRLQYQLARVPALLIVQVSLTERVIPEQEVQVYVFAWLSAGANVFELAP